MDIDVHRFGRDIEKQRQHRMPIARQHIGIGPAHRAGQQPVLHRASVDEQILMIGHAPVEGGQACHPAQHHAVALQIDRYAVLDQPRRRQRGDTFRPAHVRLHGQGAPPVMVQREADLRSRHGQPFHDIQRGGIFAARRAQEFAPRGHLGEQFLHADARSRRDGGGPFRRHRAMIDGAAPALAVHGAAFDRQPRDRGDGRQRLTAKAERFNEFERFILAEQAFGQLGRCVPFERQRHLRAVHAAAIVRDLDQPEAPGAEANGDAARAGIDGVLDDLLQRAGGPFHHLAGGDAVDQGFGEPSY